MVDPARCVSDTVHHYFQPVRWSAAPDVPVTYVLNERDRPVPAALQEEMVARLPHPPTVIRFDTGHLPPVTHPEAFAEVVEPRWSEMGDAERRRVRAEEQVGPGQRS